MQVYDLALAKALCRLGVYCHTSGLAKDGCTPPKETGAQPVP